MADLSNDVYDLDEDEEVSCHFCIQDRKFRAYRKGEAFLAGPGHTPFNANANYICLDHLDSDAVICRGDVIGHPRELAENSSVSEAEK